MWRKKNIFQILCEHCPKMVFLWNFGPLAATEDINQFPKKIHFSFLTHKATFFNYWNLIWEKKAFFDTT